MGNLFNGAPRELSLLAAIFLGTTGCGGGNPSPPKMTNEPGVVSAPAAGKLSGHFEIRAALPGDPFIFSSGMGGACLVAQYPVEPASCTKHTECALPPAGTGEQAFAYCIAESPGRPTAGGGGGIPPAGAGTCWFKPSKEFCLKGVGTGQWDTPAADAATVAAATGVKKWRVLTCLNGAPGACGGAPATPNELQHQAGPIYTTP
jgi:hypothetical protein